MAKTDILITAALFPEISQIVQSFAAVQRGEFWYFEHARQGYLLTTTEIGMVNTAGKLAYCLALQEIAEIWMVGCCGSYESGMAVGDVIEAQEEINGDLGILAEEGWRGPEDFPFAILQKGDKIYRNRFPCHPLSVRSALPAYQVHRGKMLTVSTVSGTRQAASILHARFQALGENMEGAAAAQMAVCFGKPFAEIRGISNEAGDRNKSRWDLPLAFRHSQQAIIEKILEEK